MTTTIASTTTNTTDASDRLVTTIAQDQELVTLINVFKVAPENQQRLVDLLVDATEEVMCKIPGFISANVHKSLDGTRVTNYAQWRSVDDFKAIFRTPEATAHMPAITQIAESEPVLYEVNYMRRAD